MQNASKNLFVLLRTFVLPHELAIVRGHLESEDIPCLVKDALTTQTNPMLSNAIGGVKLLVRQSDFEKATQLLKEWGYYQAAIIESPPPFFLYLDNATAGMPIIGKLSPEIRLLIIVAGICSLVAACYLLFPPAADAAYQP